ncbi:MAG: hypothetical protein Q8S41_03085 [Lutibacter sp.]|nr:hypothetical protein [Lutibacter sp.]
MVLNYIHTLSIQREIKTDGHSPLLIIGSDFELYVAKNDKGKSPAFSLLNECFAAFFLHHWDICTPEFALIAIDKQLILAKEDLSVNHKPFYYDVPCFGSKFIENAIDINSFLVSEKKKAYNKLNNPLDVFHITLFDTWVENDDRKPTNYNLVLEPKTNKFNIVPIDNAFIFSTQSYEHLDPQYIAVSVNDHLLVSDLGFLIKKYTTINEDFINNQRDYFYLCINRCQQNFDAFVKEIRGYYLIDENSINKLKEFLFNKERNNNVFNEYVYRLKQ